MTKPDLPHDAWDVLAFHSNGSHIKPRYYNKWTSAFLQIGWLCSVDGQLELTVQGRKIWLEWKAAASIGRTDDYSQSTRKS